VGEVHVCSIHAAERARRTWYRVALGLVTACAMLWALSRKIAQRMTRPFDELVRVSHDLGMGKFSSRVHMSHHGGDVEMLGDVINEMAARIEKQLADQRELLAAVSHEIRTPLTRIRILMEMARDLGGADPKTLDEVDREVIEIDALVSELLASSRLEFSAMAPTRLDAGDVATRALERAGLTADRLVLDSGVGGTTFQADATLMARALANLIDNAQHHGGGLDVVRVIPTMSHVRFEIEDKGGGFAPGDERTVFDAFVQRPSRPPSSRGGNGSGKKEDRGSLGLGLALVKRIAAAHGGSVDARNREGGGASVSIEIPRT
jgi:signal transduction histidine kinase